MKDKSSVLPEILVLCSFNKNPSNFAENLLYKPETLSDSALAKLLQERKPNIIVIEHGKELAKPLKEWLETEIGKNCTILQRGKPLNKPSETEKKKFSVEEAQLSPNESENSKDQAVFLDIAAISINAAHQNMLASAIKSKLPLEHKVKHIAIVGAGIESLLTGLHLIQQGYEITFIEDSGDFRRRYIKKVESNALSVKFKALHINPSESIPFNIQRKTRFPEDEFSKGGWLVKPQEKLTEEEKQWQKSFNKIAASQPAFYAKATELCLAMNRFSMEKWEEILSNPKINPQKNILDTKGRVRYAVVSNKKISHRVFVKSPSLKTHLYGDDEARFRLLNDNLESKEELKKSEIEKQFPGVANITRAIPVEGYSLNITQLVHNLITYLEARGANFHWRTKVTSIEKNNNGKVSRLKAYDGQQEYHIKADDYVISTGNAGNSLLSSTKSHNKVQKLTGLWATIPNVTNIKESFKIMASEQLSVCNVTVSEDGSKLYVCGGHGYIGLDDKINLEEGEGKAFKENFVSLVRETFPAGYAEATKGGKEPLEIIACDRPSTADGLPIIEEIEAENGKLIANVGHNCGGFVLAPLMAWVVEQTLAGKPNILKEVLSPERESINHSI